jgi:hypothetical protein
MFKRLFLVLSVEFALFSIIHENQIMQSCAVALCGILLFMALGEK